MTRAVILEIIIERFTNCERVMILVRVSKGTNPSKDIGAYTVRTLPDNVLVMPQPLQLRTWIRCVHNEHCRKCCAGAVLIGARATKRFSCNHILVIVQDQEGKDLNTHIGFPRSSRPPRLGPCATAIAVAYRSLNSSMLLRKFLDCCDGDVRIR